MKAKLRVLRPFLLGGERQEIDSVIEVDLSTAAELMNCGGKVEPADRATSGRLTSVETCTWSVERERSSPARKASNYVMRGISREEQLEPWQVIKEYNTNG